MHDVEQLRARVRRAAEPVGHLAVREMRVHLARMHGAAFADECQHRRRLLGARRGPDRARRARMHQLVMRARQIAVVDEEVFLQRQLRIKALEIARAIAGDAMAQRQVLRAGRRADRIGLHESQLVDRAPERGRLEQRARDGVAAQMFQGDRHAAIIFQSPSDAATRCVPSTLATMLETIEVETAPQAERRDHLAARSGRRRT